MKKILLIFLLLVNCVVLFSKEKQRVNKSVKFFEEALSIYYNEDYQEAVRLLNKSILYDTLNVKSYLLLSDIYRELKQSEEQRGTLLKVVEIDSVSHPLAYKFLGLICYENGDYDLAQRYFERYLKLYPKDSVWTKQNIENCEDAFSLYDFSKDLQIVALNNEVNTDLNEYWPVISSDDSTLYFTRLITDRKPYAYERLFVSNLTPNGWGKAQTLLLNSDDRINEGTMCISADGNLIIYTACGLADGKGSCDLYYMYFYNGKWSRPRNIGIPVNSMAWEAQPSVTSFNNRLYFTSNRKGGFGGSDIWVSDFEIQNDGTITFSAPQNLGEKVNSKGNDFSPFIHADNETLYFASDGRGGFGKSDIFFTTNQRGQWTKPINLGYPINSKWDDDGLIVSPTARIAIFSSNRNQKERISKDLFQFELPEILKPNNVGYVKGNVFDKKTGRRLNASINVNDLDLKRELVLFSDSTNGYIFTMKKDNNYSFNVNKPGYMFYSENFNLKKAENFKLATVYDIFLESINSNLKVVLNNIFFEFDSSVLAENSKIELSKLIDFLKTNPTVVIEISGHTDNVGNENYNRKLSEKRAISIKEYLCDQISMSRVIAKGFGSSLPIANNNSEENRAKNRRSELRIISY